MLIKTARFFMVWKRMSHFAILHYTLPPVIGGVERMIRDQAAALRHLGHEVSCYDGSANARQEFQQKLAAGCFQVVLVHNVFTMPFALEWTQQLIRNVSDHPEVRWVNWVHDVARINPAYASLPWHAPDYECLKKPVPGAWNVTVSEARRAEYAGAVHLEKNRIRVVPNGLDFPRLMELTPRVAQLDLLRSDEWILVHPARLVRRKNIELGLRVLAAMRARGAAVRYLITGAPDPHQADGLAYHRELCALAKALRVEEQVTFLGESAPLTEADVRSLYACADVLFFPSVGEGFGLPLLEAVALRVPVWCSDLPVHREVLGSAGNYFSIDAEPAAISAQILHEMNSGLSAQRRQLLQRYAMQKICQEDLVPWILGANESLIPA
jgi:mannosylglucosylglycerate synthase